MVGVFVYLGFQGSVKGYRAAVHLPVSSKDSKHFACSVVLSDVPLDSLNQHDPANQQSPLLLLPFSSQHWKNYPPFALSAGKESGVKGHTEGERERGQLIAPIV